MSQYDVLKTTVTSQIYFLMENFTRGLIPRTDGLQTPYFESKIGNKSRIRYFKKNKLKTS